MNTNKILSADLLDLIFDGRNKEYGAYELRKTYPERMKRGLLIAMGITTLAFTTVVMGNSVKSTRSEVYKMNELTLEEIKPDEPEPLPPPEKLPEPEPARTIADATPIIVPDPEVTEPPPTQEEIANAKIDVVTNNTGSDEVTSPAVIDGQNKGIIEAQVEKEPEIFREVAVQASYDGDWTKFLIRNLNGNVPVDNGAPVGKYKVVIQFVVDLDGHISDVIAMSNAGYGMEQEAIRVIKKSAKWRPAIQNGHEVKAFRSQPIVFEVGEQ